MSRFLRSFVLLAAAAVSALVCYVAVTLPARTAFLGGAVPASVVFGAYHIHTVRSDGSGTPDDVAAAAARSGLAFVILTDHGDATRPPDPPTYRHGVLCIDAVEVNTLAGHLVALGLTAPAPYPLAGEARDVVDDVHRLGGWTVIAHPDSPNPDLRWRTWTVPYDGVEWMNADSEWRSHTATQLAGAVLRSVARPAESIASLFSRPSRTLQRWDASIQVRPVVALAAVDAHARFDWRRGAEPQGHTLLERPRYEDMFRTLAQGVLLETGLSGRADEDAARVLGAIERGRTFSIVRAYAGPAALEFAADQGGQTIQMGGELPDMSLMRLHASVPGAPDAQLVLVRNGTVAMRGKGSVELVGPPSPGAYRVEAYYPGFDVPWLVSNPIYAGQPMDTGSVAPPVPPEPLSPIPLADAWHVEHDPSSTSTIQTDPHRLELNYALGGGVPAGQFAAVATDLAGADAFDGVSIVARADRPTRVSVQVRLLSGQRWRRSVYLDTTARAVLLPLTDFEPADRETTLRPTAARIRSVLVVLDTLNSLPGSHGVVTIEAVGLSRAPAVIGSPDLAPER